MRKEFRTPRIAFYGYDLLVLWVLAAIFQSRQRWVQRVHPGDHSPFELSAAARGWIAPLVARWPTPVWILAAAVLLLLLATFRSLQLIAVARPLPPWWRSSCASRAEAEIRERAARSAGCT